MWFSKRKQRRAKEAEQREKLASSQKALLEAAVTTADMAQHVTQRLRQYLEDAVRQFDATIAIIQDGVFVCRISGEINACNPAASTILGIETSEIIRHSILDFLSDDGQSLTTTDELWDRVKDGTISLRGVRGDGSTFPAEIISSRLNRSDGTAVMLLIVREMTDQLALKRDAEVGAHYRSLFELSLDGILVVRANRVVAANSQAGRLFGCRPESLLRLRFTSLVGGGDEAISDRLDDGEAFQAEALRSDGTPLPLLLSGIEITWNNEAACLITIRDISSLKNFEPKLQMPDMICCFDHDFKITYANSDFCAYYKISHKEIIGKDIRALMSESERDTFSLNLQCINAEHPTHRVRVQNCTKDGDLRLHDWLLHAFYENGKVTEYQRIGRDITALVSDLIQTTPGRSRKSDSITPSDLGTNTSTPSM